MKDLKIRPGMDTPKAKLKNPTPKDADSLLKQHMDKRQREKEPESRDPVRYATDRVEKNMRRGAAGAADTSRRMIKHYRGKLRQGKENAAREYRVADMGIGAENVFIDTSMEYAFSPVQTAARNEVGNRTISPQNCGGPKSADAAPQERGRQKAAQDAKAAYRRNLAEKRTAERHIVPPPSDRGGTTPPPHKSNQGASVKGGPAPKSRQAMTKAARTMRVRPTDHAAPNNAIITHRARAAAQRKTQRKMLQESAQSGGKASKKLGSVAVQAVKEIGKGVASAVSSILSAGGGAVVLMLILTVILVAAIVASPFGILFSNESREAGVVPISAAVAQVNYEFNERLETLQTADDYDSISVDGQTADWIEVLAVFAVKVAGSNDADAADVATMDADRITRLKAVFWDMTTIAHRIEVIHHPGSGDDDGWTERNLYITITAKTAEEMKTAYHFNRNQIAALEELLEQRDLLRELIEDVYSVSGDTAALLRDLPEGLYGIEGAPLVVTRQGDARAVDPERIGSRQGFHAAPGSRFRAELDGKRRPFPREGQEAEVGGETRSLAPQADAARHVETPLAADEAMGHRIEGQAAVIDGVSRHGSHVLRLGTLRGEVEIGLLPRQRAAEEQPGGQQGKSGSGHR